jgi:2,4-didehydro-3-deoxy-L-rhamnonate hydrolase
VRLVSYHGGFGRVEDDDVIPLGRDIVHYLASGEAEEEEPVPLEEIRLRAPVPRPEKIVLVGLNYRDHAEETGAPVPDEPVLFAKFANSLAADGEPVPLPAVTREVDYEAELGVVIGRTARDVGVGAALDHVAGYTAMNDLSARDLQLRGGQWTRGKAIDGFLPTGPWITTADEIPDPQALAIRCRVNGRLLQDSTTANMIFPVAELVSFISRTMTLRPGDLISTGTPAGVGFTREPPIFLADGDVVSVEVERIGTLTTPIVQPG